MNRIRRDRLKENIFSYLMLAPFLIVFMMFLGWPVIYSLIISFHKVSIYSSLSDVFGTMKPVGFQNYINLFKDFEFWWSILMTFYYAILTIPTGIILSLLLAVLLNNQFKFKSFYRSGFFLPNVLDMLVVGMIWMLIYSPEYGLLDQLFRKIDIRFFQQGVLSKPVFALPAIAFAMVLKGSGFGMILFLTAIQNISESVYEAADIDGATWFEKLIHITIPLVKPIILFLVITGTMGALNAFTEIYAMTGGNPITNIAGHTVGATKTSGFYLYQKFIQQKYGYAAAISYILLIIGVTISFINFKLLKKK